MKHRFLWPAARRHGWLLGLILLLGTALRLWLWWRTPVHQPANDEVEYLAVAHDLLAGRGWRFYDTYHWLRAPLYPLWLAASLWLTGGERGLSALPNIALSSFTVYLYYLLGREVVGAGRTEQTEVAQAERAGLLVGGCAAILLTLATFASLWMAETLFTALFVCALLLLLRATRPRPLRSRALLVVSGGVALGLAILTRSLPLTTVPVVGLWLASVLRQSMEGQVVQRTRLALLLAVSFVLATLLTIAPWTWRNYQAYGAFIAVETGLSYNLWWFNEPHEDEDTIFNTLASIPNPAERADYATAKGLARLREDPAILLRKLWPNFNALWMIKPIEDRFLLPTYYQDVPFGMFTTALILDDALYVVIALLGVCGLVLAPMDRSKILLGGWLVYVLLVVLLTHGEGRYRHFLFPVLLPYAAWLVSTLRVRAGRQRLGSRRLYAIAAAVLALMWTPLVLRYPTRWAGENLRRGWAMFRAEWAEQAGNTDSALAFYSQAREADPRSADVWLAIGRLELRRGNVAQALSAFDSAFLIRPSYIPVNVSRGDALRRLGNADEARRAFKGYYTDELEMLEWAWQYLETPHPTTVHVGDGLDFGYVHGMHAAEQQLGRRARWTRGRAEVKLQGSAAGGRVLLTLAAPRPDGQPVAAKLCVVNTCRQVNVGASWRTFEMIVPGADAYRLVISAPTFQPQAHDPRSADSRELGVLVEEVTLSSFATAQQDEPWLVQLLERRMAGQ